MTVTNEMITGQPTKKETSELTEFCRISLQDFEMPVKFLRNFFDKSFHKTVFKS
jgi:hypothetical protein